MNAVFMSACGKFVRSHASGSSPADRVRPLEARAATSWSGRLQRDDDRQVERDEHGERAHRDERGRPPVDLACRRPRARLAVESATGQFGRDLSACASVVVAVVIRNRPLCAEGPGTGRRDDRDHDEEDHRVGRLVGELAAREPAAEDEQRHRFGRRARSAVGEGDDGVEHLQEALQAQHDVDREERADEREGDRAELPPAARAVDRRRLVELLRDRLQPDR